MISAFEVIRAIDGPLFITSCITVRGECGQSDRCTIREPLRRVNESIEQVLRRISISEMKEDSQPSQETETKKPAELVSIT
jgi:DNA-binding IscR family transcriptional regulator